ncbi:hypothetical protein HY969_03620 [Candidatus Kaiserbacteria bacterium]|nr:hypothetical protein [Candidatus Kaiserbacteria bacterium]
MANNTANSPGRTADSSAAGWVVAAVIVVAVILGLIYLLPYLSGSTTSPAANVNVEIPNTGEQQTQNMPAMQATSSGLQGTSSTRY